MKAKSKSMLLGAALGTILLGPGYGTIVGAAWGSRKHDEDSRKSPNRGDDDDECDPYDHRQA